MREIAHSRIAAVAVLVLAFAGCRTAACDRTLARENDGLLFRVSNSSDGFIRGETHNVDIRVYRDGEVVQSQYSSSPDCRHLAPREIEQLNAILKNEHAADLLRTAILARGYSCDDCRTMKFNVTGVDQSVFMAGPDRLPPELLPLVHALDRFFGLRFGYAYRSPFWGLIP